MRRRSRLPVSRLRPSVLQGSTSLRLASEDCGARPLATTPVTSRRAPPGPHLHCTPIDRAWPWSQEVQGASWGPWKPLRAHVGPRSRGIPVLSGYVVHVHPRHGEAQPNRHRPGADRRDVPKTGVIRDWITRTDQRGRGRRRPKLSPVLAGCWGGAVATAPPNPNGRLAPNKALIQPQDFLCLAVPTRLAGKLHAATTLSLF